MAAIDAGENLRSSARFSGLNQGGIALLAASRARWEGVIDTDCHRQSLVQTHQRRRLQAGGDFRFLRWFATAS